MSAVTHIFELLNLPEEPRQFLELVWDFTQFFDDVYDGGDTKLNFDRILLSTFVVFPAAPFYRQHQATLAPALHLAIEKWKLANYVEEKREADAKSYMWRAGFYDILALVCILVGKPASVVHAALSAYGETFEDYMKEMELCQIPLPLP